MTYGACATCGCAQHECECADRQEAAALTLLLQERSSFEDDLEEEEAREF